MAYIRNYFVGGRSVELERASWPLCARWPIRLPAPMPTVPAPPSILHLRHRYSSSLFLATSDKQQATSKKNAMQGALVALLLLVRLVIPEGTPYLRNLAARSV